ncbi:hypothetical protein [Thauera sinica]|uniref:N-acetyltransferase domain-containing protein n=1 Tax=Thauera sinica TaxID=2665146 RepID=A0ABW1AXZ3_9RHOO|nr:hypothetical protein [Thauera sp. K11]ATE60139.1 hypothetical protein CCZ27_09430 [Thauera sp. K11]
MRLTTSYGSYEIEPMPGQPQIALCHSFFIVEHARGQGRASALKRHQNDVLVQQHYDLAICTVASTNTRQHSVLSKAGWVPLMTFTNSRLGGETLIYGFDVAAARSCAASALAAEPPPGRGGMTDALHLLRVLQGHIEEGKLVHRGVFSDKDFGYAIQCARHELERLRGERCVLHSLLCDANHFLRLTDLDPIDESNLSPSGNSLREARQKIFDVLLKIDHEKISDALSLIPIAKSR